MFDRKGHNFLNRNNKRSHHIESRTNDKDQFKASYFSDERMIFDRIYFEILTFGFLVTVIVGTASISF